jgi:HD-GYP domain-containing protein (c-di-GMP phosphodiesterase class II)
VSVIACGIVQRLGWSSDRLQALQMAAVVHDIGKIAIPIEILTKPKRLSDAEFLLMSEHPYTGYTILKDIPFPWPVAEIVYQHHEKIDGSGYPRGLVEMKFCRKHAYWRSRYRRSNGLVSTLPTGFRHRKSTA